MKVSIFTVVLNVSKELRFIALFVFTPIECNITPLVFTRMECTKMTGN